MNSSSIIYLSNYDKLRSNEIDSVSKYPELNKTIIKINNVDNLISRIWTYKKLFVLSSQKAASTNFFQQLFANDVHKEFEIFVENVTGWVWKNLFYAKKKEKIIMIWWVEFLITTLANWIKFDGIVILNIWWPLESNIIRDIYYYWWFWINNSDNNE